MSLLVDCAEKRVQIIENIEPSWARNIQPMVVLARGIPTRSRTLGRWAYCMACIGKDEKWYRLYPIPLEDGKRLFDPFDIVKPFIIRRNDNGRPESCRIDSNLVWKAGEIKKSERLLTLEKRIESGSFMHDDSWRTKTLGLVSPSVLKFSIKQGATINYYCDHPRCDGHTATFFDALQMEANKKRLIASAQDLNNLLSEIEIEKLRFVVGTVRKHPQRWILVETLVCLNETAVPLQSWLISKTR